MTFGTTLVDYGYVIQTCTIFSEVQSCCLSVSSMALSVLYDELV
jgi:hypothetical protein